MIRSIDDLESYSQAVGAVVGLSFLAASSLFPPRLKEVGAGCVAGVVAPDVAAGSSGFFPNIEAPKKPPAGVADADGVDDGAVGGLSPPPNMFAVLGAGLELLGL